ncbi:hypothetical protein [Luteolibacter marinus]|uniref:hypothetical protein n=1 Tax=Luteolibacter marinus TaxID=2776705 RepID=UPI00186714E3|nr:hypothetical protein [Luteolibacter marinus]
MKQPKHLKSSMAVAVAGLSAGTGQAAVSVINHDLTLTYTGTTDEQVSFDITGDGNADYRFVYANNNNTKPQITSFPFEGGGTYEPNQVMMPDSGSKVLPADLSLGTIVDGSLYGGVSLWEAFFFKNYDENAFGTWGGADTGNPIGPVEGYIALRIETGGEGSGLWNYGYAHVSIDVPAGTMTVFDTAYQDVQGQGITIVPEPSVGVLAVGALGLASVRRRRRTPELARG